MHQPSEQAKILLEKRYFKSGEDWESMCKRVAAGLSKDNKQEKEFFEVMSNAYFLPNTPCLVNAGLDGNGVLGACFILPIEDSIDSIYDTVKKAALIFKSGGGCGYDFSKLRPEGSQVASTKGVAGGPISFLKVFDTATVQLKQGGVRRGANMGSLFIDHPDIVKFIKCKDTEGEINSFNISVGMTDEFMKKLGDPNEMNSIWVCRFGAKRFVIRKSDDNAVEVAGLMQLSNTEYYTVMDIWNLITSQAWKNGEPGLLFIDEMRRRNGPDVYTTNPCLAGDTVLSVGGSKIKISDLANGIVKSDLVKAWYTGKKETISIYAYTHTNDESVYIKLTLTPDHLVMNADGNFVEAKSLKSGDKVSSEFGPVTIKLVERYIITDVYDFKMLDGPPYAPANGIICHNCGEVGGGPYTMCVLGSIDVSKFVDNEKFSYKRMDRVIRIGMGMLNRMIDTSAYPLKEIEKKAKRERNIGFGIMGFADALIKMKIKYGSKESFEIAQSLITHIKKVCKKHSQNNKSCTAIAPTGSISMLAGCSSSIEPNFAWKVVSNRKDFGTQEFIHPLAKPYFDSGDELPDYFVTADQIDPHDHVVMQSIFQTNGVDLGVSKTINLPNSASRNDVSGIYVKAWKSSCKGITVYRDGSRQEQVLSKKRTSRVKTESVGGQPRGRPRVLWGATYRVLTPAGKCFVTINEDKDGIREVFVHVSKAGSEINSHVEVEGRLISNALKYRIPVRAVISHLKDQKSSPVWEHGRSVKSVPDAIAKVIEDYIENYEGLSEYLPEDTIEYDGKKVESIVDDEGSMSGDLCSYCGEPLYIQGHCEVCRSCGNSTCG